ncbi:MAG: D-2-hydroxyacid dehydrogenase family protein [Proteobacteria bacterium]|nr:D-2-hydroxyacid dehydrogenase family protein [Pseudomonadota bacterium]
MQIAVLDDYQNVALELADWGPVQQRAQITVFRDTIADQDKLVERLKPFEIICAMRERTPFSRALLGRLPNLKCLVTTGMRNAAIDMAATADRGITVCGTEGLPYPTAELTWALILAMSRRVPLEDQGMRQGLWQRTLGTGLNGKVLGVIGLGRLGAQVAKVGLAFGMKVIAWSQNLTQARAAEVGVGYVSSKETLLTLSDIVTIHLVLSDRTRGLVGKAELALMKPTAYLINTSRGPIVDEAALIETLEGQRIGGAGLDVYDEEPLPEDHPLRGLVNTVLTPHLGYVTAEGYAVFYAHVVEDVLGYLDAKPVRVIKAK